MSKLIKEMLDALNAVNQNKTQPFDRQGEVKRIEGKIAWVKLEGSDRETPIQMTIACDVGDTVQARIGGGSAWLTGNLTAPPTDDKKANQAISMVTTVVQEVQEQVEEALEDVSTVDDVTMQYCLSDSSSTFVQYGDWSNTPPTYVSGKYYWTRSVIEDDEGNVTYGEPRYSQDTQLSVETDVAFKSNNNHFWHDSSGAYVTTTDKSYATGSAVRITSSGILQQVNGSTVSSWTNSGISFLQSGSTVASFGSGGAQIYSGGTSVASFGSTARIGSASGAHLSVSSDTLSFYKNSSSDVLTITQVYDSGSDDVSRNYARFDSNYQIKINTTLDVRGDTRLRNLDTNIFEIRDVNFSWACAAGNDSVAEAITESIVGGDKAWMPIGVVGFYITTGNVYARGAYLSSRTKGSCGVNLRVYNADAKKNVSATVHVLGIRCPV